MPSLPAGSRLGGLRSRPPFRGRRAGLLAGLVLCPLLFVGRTSSEPENSVAEQVASATVRLEATEGGKIVLRAIDAVGGLEAWYSAPTSSYWWEYSNVDSDKRGKTFQVAENGSRRVYHRLVSLGTATDPRPVAARMAWDGEDAWIWPAEIDQINPRLWATTPFYFSSIPFVFADPGVVLRALPDAELDGVAHDVVEVTFEPGVGDASDTYTLYVDQISSRLRAIRYTVTFEDNFSGRETLFYYNDYVTVDGLTVPTHFYGYRWLDGAKGEHTNEAWVTEISFREPFDESRLIMPEGGRVQRLRSESRGIGERIAAWLRAGH